MLTYYEMKKLLLQHGVNSSNIFTVNERDFYSIDDIFEKLRILPIYLINYNHIYYLKSYYIYQLDEFYKFIDSFKLAYGIHLFKYICSYLRYLKFKYNIIFL